MFFPFICHMSSYIYCSNNSITSDRRGITTDRLPSLVGLGNTCPRQSKKTLAGPMKMGRPQPKSASCIGSLQLVIPILGHPKIIWGRERGATNRAAPLGSRGLTSGNGHPFLSEPHGLNRLHRIKASRGDHRRVRGGFKDNIAEITRW